MKIEITEEPFVTSSSTNWFCELDVNGKKVDVRRSIYWDENCGVTDEEIEILNEEEFSDKHIEEIKEYVEGNVKWD